MQAGRQFGTEARRFRSFESLVLRSVAAGAGGYGAGKGDNKSLPPAMTIQVTGKNRDVGAALRSYVQERIAHAVEKFIGRETTGHVRIEKERSEFRTDCTIHLWQGMSLEAHGAAADAYQSADRACERLEKRIRRYKERLKRHGGETPRKETPAAGYVIQAVPEDHEEHDEGNPVIIAEAEMPVHEMAVSDAVMQMDLSDRPVVVFRNASHGEINVVYRRGDGNIGWIDPTGPLSSKSAAVAQQRTKKARKRGEAGDPETTATAPRRGNKMLLTHFIAPNSVVPLLKVKSKKQLLQGLSARAARITGVPERDIFDVLWQRERLGSTGLGHGVAIPHGKLQGLKRIAGVFARLAEPIDFEAIDGQKVDIVVLLLAPEGAGADHLKALARISRLLRDAAAVEKLRAAKDAAALYAVLTEGETSSHAA